MARSFAKKIEAKQQKQQNSQQQNRLHPPFSKENLLKLVSEILAPLFGQPQEFRQEDKRRRWRSA